MQLLRNVFCMKSHLGISQRLSLYYKPVTSQKHGTDPSIPTVRIRLITFAIPASRLFDHFPPLLRTEITTTFSLTTQY